MSVKLKSLVLVSIFAASAFASVPAAESASKKRKARATPASSAASQEPYRGGMVSRGGLPKWVQYDQGGMYYYSKNELEKARQYWLAALKIAEQVVPAEKAKGLSTTTEQQVCNLIDHLVMMVSDSKLNPKGAIYGSHGYGSSPTVNASSYSDPRRLAYDNMAAHIKMINEDYRWFDRITVFAERTVGKDCRCLSAMKNTLAQIKIGEVNTKYTMSTLEKELNISRSSIDNRPNNANNPGSNNNGLAPNGEYLPPGQIPQ